MNLHTKMTNKEVNKIMHDKFSDPPIVVSSYNVSGSTLFPFLDTSAITFSGVLPDMRRSDPNRFSPNPVQKKIAAPTFNEKVFYSYRRQTGATTGVIYTAISRMESLDHDSLIFVRDTNALKNISTMFRGYSWANKHIHNFAESDYRSAYSASRLTEPVYITIMTSDYRNLNSLRDIKLKNPCIMIDVGSLDLSISVLSEVFPVLKDDIYEIKVIVPEENGISVENYNMLTDQGYKVIIL